MAADQPMALKSSLPSAGQEARPALPADRRKRRVEDDTHTEPSESESASASASHSSDHSAATAHSSSRQQRKKARRTASPSARRRSRSRSRSASPSPSSDDETPSSASSASSCQSASSSVSSHSEYLPSDRSANSGSEADEDSDEVVSMDESNSDAESDRKRKARRAAPRSKRRHSVSSSPSASSDDEPAPSSQADDQAEPDRSDAQSDGDDEPEPPHEDAAKSSSDEEEEEKEESDEGDEPDDSSSDSHLSDPEWTPSHSGSDADEDSASEESDSNSDAESDSDTNPLEDDQFCVDEEAFLEMREGEYKELVLRRQAAYVKFKADLGSLRNVVPISADYFPPYRFRAARKWKGYYKEAERWINMLQKDSKPNFKHFHMDIDQSAKWSAVWAKATAQIGRYTIIWLHVTVGSGGHSNLLILDHESALVASSAGGAASSSASSSSARRPASASASASSSHRQLKSAWIFEPHGYAKHADRPTLKEFLQERNFEWRSCYKANSKQLGPQSLECRSTFHSSLNFLTNRGNCLLWSCLFIHCLLAGSSVEKAAKALRTLADDSAAILMSTYLTRVVRDLQLKGQPAAALESSDGRRLHPYEKGVALLRKTLRSRLGKPAGFALFLYDVEAGRRDRQPHPKYRGVFYGFPSAEMTVAAVLQEASVYFNRRVCTMVREYLSGPPGKAVVCLRSGLALTADVARKLPIGAMQQRATNRFQLWIYRPEESQVKSICKERGLCVNKLFLDGSSISAHPMFHWSKWSLRSLWGRPSEELSRVRRIRVSFECRWSKRETGGPARPGPFTWTFPARRWSDLTVAYLWTEFLQCLHTRRKEWIAEAAADEEAQAAAARRGSSAKSKRSQRHRQLQCMLEAATKGLRHWRDFSVELLDDSGNELDIPTRKEVAAEKSRLRQLAKEADEKEEQRRELAPLKELVLLELELAAGKSMSRTKLKNKVATRVRDHNLQVKVDKDRIQLVLDEVAEEVESGR